MPQLIPDGTLISHYRITAHLGSGGMGEVYRATDNSLGRPVALKILRSELVRNDDRLRRFVQEAKAASSLNHPNVVHIYEIGNAPIDGQTAPPVSFIAMELIEGTTLRERIYSDSSDVKKLLALLEQVAEGLAKAHAAGLVHRDLKPDNIMVSADGYAKVVDFGLAKLITGERPSFLSGEEATVDRQQATQEGSILGTIGYMSPEQIAGEAVDQRSDIFSFGCILYEALAHERAFAGSSTIDTLHKILHDDPPPLGTILGGGSTGAQRIVRRCLAKDRNDRYQSMKEVAIELRDLRKELETPGDIGSLASRALSAGVPNVPRTGRYLFAAACVVALAVFAVTLVQRGSFRGTDSGQDVHAKAAEHAQRPTQPPNVSANAYDAYIRAKVNVKDENAASNDKAIKLLESAVATDPQFAPAYAALARAYNSKSFYSAPAGEKAQFDENAAVAVDKALALDPNLAEAHLARGLILWTHANGFQHEEAASAYKHAIALNPSLDEAHHQLAVIYFHVGLYEKARRELETTLSLNPSNSLARFRLGVIDQYRGQYEKALLIFRSTPLKKNPSLWTYATAYVLFRLGRNDEAAHLVDDFLQKYPKDEGGGVTSVKALMLAQSGRRKEAGEAIQRAVSLGNGFGHFHHTAYNIALAYALLHKPTEAVQYLQVAADDGFPCYPLFQSDSDLDAIRDDPRFISLMSHVKTQFETYARTF